MYRSINALIIVLLVICITFISVMGISSYLFYRRAFNWTIYYNLSLVESNCSYFYKTINEIIETRRVGALQVSELESFFYGAMEGLQQLNEYSDMTKDKYHIDLRVYIEIPYYIESLKSKCSSEDGGFNLEDGEINYLKVIKVPFQAIYNVIGKETQGVLNGVDYGDNNMIRNKLWLRGLKILMLNLVAHKLRSCNILSFVNLYFLQIHNIMLMK